MAGNRKIRKEPLKIGEDSNDLVFEKHEYDVDIMDVYHSMQKLLTNSSNIKSNINKEDYLKNFRYGIECYCKARKIDFDFHLNSAYLIIPSTEEYYVYCVGMALTCYDQYKIRAFLNYQKKKYTGNDNFVDLVEFGVYTVLNNSPFEDRGERLSAIMSWVEEERNKQEENSIPKIKRPVPGKVNKKRKPTEIKSFEELFTDRSRIEGIINILKRYDIVNKEGSWNGITNKNSEILALIEILREKHYIKKYPQTLTAKLFCEKFKLELSDRSLRTKTQAYYNNLDEYARIIPDLKS